jgi:hypothetical protein
MAHSMVIPPPLDTLAKPYHPKGGLPHKLLLYGALPADKLTAYPNHQLDPLSGIQATGLWSPTSRIPAATTSTSTRGRSSSPVPRTKRESLIQILKEIGISYF